ncbi:MAG: sugar transferase [Alphaproteobacteria bacterium]|nr:sugar transferase [Alphaproteobacteria bacterium]
MLNIGADVTSTTVLLRRPFAERKTKAAAFALKRGMDIAVAATLLLLLSPVLLAVAAAVKLTSRGPVFFAQRRWGRGNAPFRLYKFRSMYVDLQDNSGIAHTVQNDPRVTAVGRFIRKYSLDELPQLINVLKGDMSLVGPRAHVLGMHAMGVRYEDLVPEYFARHIVRPGMTGLAQVRGFRGEIADEGHARGRVACDLEYIRTFSLWQDVKIMVLTIPAVLFGYAAV